MATNQVERTDIKLKEGEEGPVIEVPGAKIQLRTVIDGEHIRNVEKDHHDGPYFILVSDEDEVVGEISPVYEAKDTAADTVELDETIIDADFAHIDSEIYEAAIDAVGQPDHLGTLPDEVRVSGTLTIEPVEDSDE